MATSKVWKQDMLEKLNARSNFEFVPIFNPKELNLKKITPIDPQYIFFPHWSHRIDPEIYKKFECIIFHMTDLPFGRGGSPLQNLIARGIYKTKISALLCVEEMDAGPIYLKKPLSLHGSAKDIFLRASNIIEDMIIEILETSPKPKPQKGTVTTFKRRNPEQSDLSSAKSLTEIFDTIRMLDAKGYPNAFLNMGYFKIEFAGASKKINQVLADVRISLIDDSKKGF